MRGNVARDMSLGLARPRPLTVAKLGDMPQKILFGVSPITQHPRQARNMSPSHSHVVEAGNVSVVSQKHLRTSWYKREHKGLKLGDISVTPDMSPGLARP